MVEAVLRIDNGAGALIDALLDCEDLEAERFDPIGIDGGGDLATLIVTLSGGSLTALVSILRARWARARFVKIEVDGVKVEGASPEQIEAILGRMLKQRDKAPAIAPPDVPQA